MGRIRFWARDEDLDKCKSDFTIKTDEERNELQGAIINGQEKWFRGFMALVEEYKAERIVVGLPRSMNGDIGMQAEEILSFSGALAEHVDIPVDTWDERLSTVTAERLLIDTGMKRKKRKGKLDAMAAAIILQAYLDGTNK